MQSGLDQEKERSHNREQEAFSARYQLVGVQEELANMMERVKVVEQERDALRTIAKNEEIARIAAEGRIPLPQLEEDDEFASPRKASRILPAVTVLSSAASEDELDEIMRELQWHKQRAERAHEKIEFMQMECQFECCSCRVAQNTGTKFIHDGSLEEAISQKRQRSMEEDEDTHPSSPQKRRCHQQAPAADTMESAPGVDPGIDVVPVAVSAVQEEPPSIQRVDVQSVPDPSMLIRTASEERDDLAAAAAASANSAHTRTPSCEPPSAAIQGPNASLLLLLDTSSESNLPETSARPAAHSQSTYPSGLQISHKLPQSTSQFRSHTYTTTIPLADASDDAPKAVLLSVKDGELDTALSPTMTRAEALAQIRERRGRARSLAQGTMTPRKQMVEGAGIRRDISAPAIRGESARGRSQVRA